MTRLTRAALAATILTGLGAASAQAEPGGCLKYGAAGAVAGHVAHHHGVLGAVGGCATGMVVRHEHRKHLREQRQQQSEGGSNTHS